MREVLAEAAARTRSDADYALFSTAPSRRREIVWTRTEAAAQTRAATLFAKAAQVAVRQREDEMMQQAVDDADDDFLARIEKLEENAKLLEDEFATRIAKLEMAADVFDGRCGGYHDRIRALEQWRKG